MITRKKLNSNTKGRKPYNDVVAVQDRINFYLAIYLKRKEKMIETIYAVYCFCVINEVLFFFNISIWHKHYFKRKIRKKIEWRAF